MAAGPAFGPVSTEPVFPGATVPVSEPSMAQKLKRRRRSNPFRALVPILFGLVLLGAFLWIYRGAGPQISGERTAVMMKGSRLKPKAVPASDIDVPGDVKEAVLKHFEEDPEQLLTSMVSTHFTAGPEGLIVSVSPGNDTEFFRFEIDAELRKWVADNSAALTDSRDKPFARALKDFFTGWEVAIRNESTIEDFQAFRDSVGLTACVEGLGYNLSAQVGDTLYPCVYEDANDVYFLLPTGTKKFKVTGRQSNGAASLFAGGYDVTVIADDKRIAEPRK